MVSSPLSRGAFIVFEGLDRSGKTTQSARLLSRLRASGVPCVDAVWRFPDRSTLVGGLLNSVITQSADLAPRSLHLLFTSNRWERAVELRSLLESGVTVVADRYSYSGVAYSVAAEGLPVGWCKGVEAGLVAADAVVYLRVDPEDAEKRGGYGEERYEKVEIQKRIRKVFEDSLVEEEKKPGEGGWTVVEGGGGRSIEDVEQDVWKAVSSVCEAVKDTPVAELWGL